MKEKTHLTKITSTADLEKIGVHNVEFSDLMRGWNQHYLSKQPPSRINSTGSSNNMIIAQGGNYQVAVYDGVLHYAGEEFTWPVATGVFGTTAMTRLELTGDVRQWTSTEVVSGDWAFCAEVGIVYFHNDFWGWMPPLVYFTTWEDGYHNNAQTELFYGGDFWYGNTVSLAVGRDDSNFDIWYAFADIGWGWEQFDQYDYGEDFMGYPMSTFECDIDPEDPGVVLTYWWDQNWLPPGFGWVPTDWDYSDNTFQNVESEYYPTTWNTWTT